MNIELIKNKFKKHASKYDIKDQNIIRKYNHSIRVMELCKLLAYDNNFSESDIEISILVGLLHDYARFEQWTKYKTFSDIKSIDHGDLAVKRLFIDNEIKDYCDKLEYYDEIYDAIKYHNKHSFPNNLSKHNKLICKVIRDADKLDIFYLLGINEILILEDDLEISKKIESNFYNNQTINYLDVFNKSDDLILKLAMVFDLNFDYSFKYLYENKLIDKIFLNVKNKDKFKPYFDYINKYIESRVK